MHNDSLAIGFKQTLYVNTKNLVIVFLLLAYGTSCFVSPFIFAKKAAFNVSGYSALTHTSENSGFPSSIPLTTEQESSDAEDDFSEDDENFIVLSSISFFMSEVSSFHYLNSSQLPGSLSLPFSPPEIPA